MRVSYHLAQRQTGENLTKLCNGLRVYWPSPGEPVHYSGNSEDSQQHHHYGRKANARRAAGNQYHEDNGSECDDGDNGRTGVAAELVNAVAVLVVSLLSHSPSLHGALLRVMTG